MQAVTGYDLALRVLNHGSDGVEKLLELSGNDESSWLELKAGMTLLPEDVKRGEKPDDLYWNIAKAVISLMNTSGGIILIGIDDKTHAAVPLQANDPRHVIGNSGLEAYRRTEIRERIWPDSKFWKYKNMTWKIQDPVPDLIEITGKKYRGEDIAAILVKPAPRRHCIRIWKNGEVEQILVREPGELGKVKAILGSRNMEEYEENRQIETPFLASLYERFLQEVENSSDAGIIQEAIRQYCLKFDSEIRKKRLFDLSCFIDLSGSGELSEEEDDEDDFMAPHAIEVFESDDWLSPGSGDGDDEEDEEDDDGADDEDREEDDEDTEPRREQRSGALISLMKEIPRIVILGEPGGGKTTALIRFCTLFDNIGEDSAVPETLAVFIPMGQWINGGSLAALLTSLTGLAAAQWSELIRQGRLRLVIDAFNECPDQYKAAALLDLQNFLRQYPALPVVISARTDAELKTLRLPMFTVQPMDREQQRLYLGRYLKDEAAADELMNRLGAISGGFALAANPMLLRLIVEVFRLSRTIPNGRAGLYHQWLSQWYKREFDKARAAGAPLPWDFDDALAILSELAMRGRLQGYRDIPLDFAREILGEYGPDCLEKLCQGPVVTIDNDFIRFRHETFQEYLCAERLVREPELLAVQGQKELSQWTMVLAYVAELCWPLPDALWLAAWRINPWFGVALTDEKRAQEITDDAFTGLRPEYKGKTLTFGAGEPERLFYHILRGTEPVDIGPLDRPFRQMLNSVSEYIEYVILTKEVIKKRWILFELWKFSACKNFGSIQVFCNDSIAFRTCCRYEGTTIPQLLKRYGQSTSIRTDLKEKLKDVTSLCDNMIVAYLERPNPDIVLQLLSRDIVRKDDFAGKFQGWKGPFQIAVRLVEAGVARKEDFAAGMPQWIKGANLQTAERLIDLGWATKEDFADKVLRWRKGADPQTEKRLMDAGLTAKEDFADKISGWIQYATPETATQLIDLGWATKKDFADKVSGWKQHATPQTAKRLIALGLATREDFTDKVSGWIQRAVPQTAWRLIVSGFATKEDFASHIPDWIAIADAASARRMVACGLATMEDFKDRFSLTESKVEGYVMNHVVDGGDMKIYTKDMLIDGTAVSAIRKELAGKKWRMMVCYSTQSVSFFAHHAFPDNVFAYNPKLNAVPEVGSIWSVEVTVSLNPKKACYQFSAASAEQISATAVGDDHPIPAAASAPVTRPAAPPAADIDEERVKFAEFTKILQKMCSAQKESVFLTVRPENWGISFEFCKSHREEVKRLLSVLQSLANSTKKTKNAVAEKRNELAQLVYSCPEFKTIFHDMAPPVVSAAGAAGADGQPPANKKAVAKTAAPKIRTNLNYDPEINFGNGVAAAAGTKVFSKNSSHIRIYIDETWPGTQSREYDDVGVIGGIVWDGAAPDYAVLPHVKTHLRGGAFGFVGPRHYHQALDGLFRCDRAFPFVFPIFKSKVNESDYPELLRIALITLLGWVLPQDGVPCTVEIFCEGISTAQMTPGKNYADELIGVCNALHLTSGRMRRWKIARFESLHSDDKEFEYVPYADALGYLTVPTAKAQRWGKPFDVWEMPGYIPLTGALVRQLKDLDSASPAGVADAFFELAGSHYKTKLFFHIFEQVIKKANEDKEFRGVLFERLETMFEDKQRDVLLLGNLSRELARRFPATDFDHHHRQKLIRLLVELQGANHQGSPELVCRCAEQYRELHDELLADNRELCIYADMNLAVHYNDMFDFAAAAEICRPWEKDPSFPYLSARIRGIVLSSIGQSYAFTGDHRIAQEYFIKAIKVFNGSQPKLTDEIDQTGVYCALNALDGKFYSQATRCTELIFGCGFDEFIARCANNTAAPFHHHLLLRNLVFNPEAEQYRAAYLARRAEWMVAPQHPWELIELYRILLLNDLDPEAAKARIPELRALFKAMKGGGIIRLIEAFAYGAISRCCGDTALGELVPDLLTEAEKVLPKTADCCARLRQAAVEELAIAEMLRILPFNYK